MYILHSYVLVQALSVVFDSGGSSFWLLMYHKVDDAKQLVSTNLHPHF